MAEVPDSCLRSGMQPVLDTLVKDVARDLVSVSLLDARTKTKTKIDEFPHFFWLPANWRKYPSLMKLAQVSVGFPGPLPTPTISRSVASAVRPKLYLVSHVVRT